MDPFIILQMITPCLVSLKQSKIFLLNVLTEESEVAINWFSSNKTIVNPDKFKSVILTKNKSDDVPTGLSIGTDIVSIEKSVKLLGIHLDNRLNFNLHINTICKSASKQLTH